MAITSGQVLVNGIDLPTSTSNLISPSVKTVITHARLVNHTAGPIVVNIYVLQSGESTADRFKAVDGRSLAAGETYLLPEIVGQAIEAGGNIAGDADTVSSVSISATGTEFT